MNKIILTGNLTKDSELMQVGEKKTHKLSFTIANNEGYGDNKKTNFINCVLWGKTAESLNKYLTKGTKILINGKIDIRSYDKDGDKKYITEVVCDMFNGIEFIGARRIEEGQENSKDINDNGGIWEAVDEGSTPF